MSKCIHQLDTATSGKARRNPSNLFVHATQATRYIVAAILIFAAIAKTSGYLLQPLPQLRVRTLMQVEIEMLLGVWLLCGIMVRAAWLAAVCCFGAFAALTLIMTLRGDSSCGCLGALDVSPRQMLVLDSLVLAALLLWRPGFERRPQRPASGWAIRFGAVAIVSLGLCAMLIVHAQPAVVTPEGQIEGRSALVVLAPEQWIGGRLPLMAHLQSSARLDEGQWTLIFHRSDCPKCNELLQQLVQRSRDPTPTRRYAIVELDKQSTGTLSPAHGVVLAALSAERSWLLTPGTVVDIDQGKVVAVRYALDAQSDDPDAEQAPVVATAIAPDRLVVDLGFVEPRSVHKVLYRLKNDADAELAIRSVEVECACTRLLRRPQLIPAGDCVDVEAIFEAPKDAQSYAKRILFHTDHPNRPLLSLELKARVGLPLRLVPDKLWVPQAGASDNLFVELHNDGNRPVKLLYSLCDSADYSIGVPRRPVMPKTVQRLEVRVHGLANRQAAACAQVITEDPVQPVLRLAIQTAR
jgi:hypothetical protein